MTQHTAIGSMHQRGASTWWRAYLQHRYAVLFYSLLLTLIGQPILKAIGTGGDFMPLFLGVNLLAASLPIDSRKGRWALLAAVLVSVVSVEMGGSELSTASLLLLTLIALYAVFGLLRCVLHSSTITPEHLYAALSAYLLAGMFLGVLYWSLEQVWPDSIIVNGPGASDPFLLGEGMYFSFITLATVGYGDIVPGNAVVRNIAIAEAIAGQFYLAVMIARLMSLYMREAR